MPGMPVEGDRFRLEAGSTTSEVLVVRREDGLTVGSFDVAMSGVDLTILALCIQEAHRGYGAGSEAANMLVAVADAAGIQRIRAWAHPQLGLSAYFWGRMGLRPLHGPGPEGGIWYERRRV